MLHVIMSAMHDRERALVGAMLLDHRVARLLLAELEQDDFEDLTCLAVLWALRELQAEVESSDLDALWAVGDGYWPPFSRVRTVGELVGMPEEVAALVEPRPELLDALAAGRAVVEAMAPVEGEPVVELARALLG